MINYHTHTYLCGHASGSIDEYIEKAIQLDIKELGFADHAPIPLPQRKGITMEPGQVELYISEILTRKEKYHERIDIRLGFEVDYPLFHTFDERYFTDDRIDYLIGSCHFLGDWAFDHPKYMDEFDRRNIDDIYREYYGHIKNMITTGLFNFIGHFDLVKKFGHRPLGNFTKIIEEIADLCSKHDVAYEVNTAGLLKPVNEIYPSEQIISILFNKNVPVTLGADAHEPDLVGYYIPEAVEILKQIGYRKISGFKNRKRYDIML